MWIGGRLRIVRVAGARQLDEASHGDRIDGNHCMNKKSRFGSFMR
jgi:hypothetical protein